MPATSTGAAGEPVKRALWSADIGPMSVDKRQLSAATRRMSVDTRQMSVAIRRTSVDTR